MHKNHDTTHYHLYKPIAGLSYEKIMLAKSLTILHEVRSSNYCTCGENLNGKGLFAHRDHIEEILFNVALGVYDED